METEFALSLGTQRWPLPATADEITLGRAANADVRLPPDDQISRIHARLIRTGPTWALHDASRNGTGLNGRRLTAPTQLTDNDQINIGRSVLTFHAIPAAAGTSSTAQPPAASSPPAPAAPGHGTSGAQASPGTPSSSFDRPAGPGAQSAPGTPPSAPDGPPAQGVQPGAPAAFPPSGSAGAQASPYQREWNDEPNRWTMRPPADQADANPNPADSHPPVSTDPASPSDGRPGPASPSDGRPGPASPSDEHPGSASSSDEHPGELGPASTTPPPPAPARAPLTPRPAPPRSPAAGTTSAAPDDVPGDSPFAPSSPHPEAPRNDPYPADRASISQPNPADAGNSASWPGYPSADYLESARSPWSGDERAQIETPRTPYPERVEYPDYPDEPNIGGPKKPKRPERRPRENADEAGRVRLARVLAIAGAMLAVGLVINLIATFLADGPGGMLRWLIAPILALLGAMTFAVLDAVSPNERPPSRLDVSVVVAIAAVLVGVGIGGFAITSGAEYAAGYLSGNETGEDRLIKPVGKTTAGLAITVDNVTNTSHFTRIRLTVTNNGDGAISLPLDGNATFTSADGNSIRADGSRSNWPDKFPVGTTQQGTIVFKGHLPMGLKTAILTLRPGDPPIVLSSIPLSN
ncbi:FHA domain-containing protein [Kribbella sp. NPDC005582]|uniref:FHA domain-containing protein n=1 Tax=Kribbella sp. NPDC005582 TaxID=3156893 RepID=UPI0033B75903